MYLLLRQNGDEKVYFHDENKRDVLVLLHENSIFGLDLLQILMLLGFAFY